MARLLRRESCDARRGTIEKCLAAELLDKVDRDLDVNHATIDHVAMFRPDTDRHGVTDRQFATGIAQQQRLAFREGKRGVATVTGDHLPGTCIHS